MKVVVGVLLLFLVAVATVAAQFDAPQPFTADACSKGLVEDGDGPMCLAYIPRYYWDSKGQQCVLGIYGGCRATANNFQDLNTCEATAKKYCLGD